MTYLELDKIVKEENKETVYKVTDTFGNHADLTISKYRDLVNKGLAKITLINIEQYIINSIDCRKDLSFEESNLGTVDLSKLDMSSCICMACMFMATEAKKVDLSNVNTSKVTDMSGMFEGVSNK